MSEIELFLLYFGLALLVEIAVGGLCYRLARKRGRDTIGWFLAGFVFSGVALSILLLLPAVETPGQTKRCESCGRIVEWRASFCPSCRSALAAAEPYAGAPVRRPLRSCFLYAAIFCLLALFVLGLIGYYCVPDQTQPQSPEEERTRDLSYFSPAGGS
ncbi:MAG: hypothetical protein AB1640_01545 [bacterium]